MEGVCESRQSPGALVGDSCMAVGWAGILGSSSHRG